jgi:hypothetical protein
MILKNYCSFQFYFLSSPFVQTQLYRNMFIHSSVICQTHDRSTASSKTIPPLNAI